MTQPADSSAVLARRPKPVWRRLLPLIGLVVLAFILSRLDGRAMADAVSRVSPLTLVLSFAAFTANMFLKALRWQRLLVVQGIDLPPRESLAAFLSGQFYAQITLGRVGEFFRAEVLLGRGVSPGRALASCVFDRLLDVIIVFGLGATFAIGVLSNPTLALVALGALLVGLAVLVWLMRAVAPQPPGAAAGPLRRFVRGLAQRPLFARLLGGLRDLLQGMLPMLRPAPLSEALFWSAISWFGYFEALFQLADGLGLGVSRVLLTATAAVAALSALLPVTVSGLGARELIYIQVLRHQGVPNEAAVVLSLLHLLVMSGSALGIGFIGVLWRQRQLR
jgi:glycosyltransferase 2 family protein